METRRGIRDILHRNIPGVDSHDGAPAGGKFDRIVHVSADFTVSVCPS